MATVISSHFYHTRISAGLLGFYIWRPQWSCRSDSMAEWQCMERIPILIWIWSHASSSTAKPLLNCCVQLNLPADFAPGPGHILELVEPSVLRASNKYDPAERCQWVNEEWQGLIEVLKSGVLGTTFPKLICSIKGWLEDDIPSEYRTSSAFYSGRSHVGVPHGLRLPLWIRKSWF